MSIGNSPEDDRPSIGRAIQQARIDAGLTVDEVSATTRVRVPIVQGIEQDDFSRCGGDVYARGHLRTLARAVGLDPEPLIAQFDGDRGGRPEPTPAAPLFEAERIRPERGRPNWTAAMVAAIVAVVGFVGFTLFSGGGDKSAVAEGDNTAAPVQPTKPPAGKTGKTTKPSTVPGPGASESAIAGVPKDKVTIKITAKDGQSWISAKDANGRLLEDGLLKKGESKTFTDKKRIDLVVGNAGVVQLFVNGKEVDKVGDKGAVERLSYSAGPQAG
ncbi:helix-turn-helix domain-containing protein [Streptomyces sp. NPDC059788]|uniref:helix-turn-helix domain-containing protein n=1 Tax=Streptomyces sp. NPDC059788 TaxID=3346948 RepID=UPI00364FA0B6